MSDNRHIIDELNMAVRLIHTARMLPPMDTPLNEEQKDAVRRSYRSYTNSAGIFASEVAKSIGVAGSTLNQWLTKSYKGDNEKVTRKINRFLENHARAAQAKINIEYVPTRVAEGLRTLAHLIHRQCNLGIAIMPSGTGKTMVLKTLTEELIGFYIYAHELLTPRQFLVEAGSAVGVPIGNYSAAELQRRIIEKLRGTNRPMFVDEAHRLPPPVFPILRTIHDQAGVAILLAGTYRIVECADDSAGGAGQWISRATQFDALSEYFNIEDPGGGGGAALSAKRPL